MAKPPPMQNPMMPILPEQRGWHASQPRVASMSSNIGPSELRPRASRRTCRGTRRRRRHRRRSVSSDASLALLVWMQSPKQRERASATVAGSRSPALRSALWSGLRHCRRRAASSSEPHGSHGAGSRRSTSPVRPPVQRERRGESARRSAPTPPRLRRSRPESPGYFGPSLRPQRPPAATAFCAHCGPRSPTASQGHQGSNGNK